MFQIIQTENQEEKERMMKKAHDIDHAIEEYEQLIKFIHA